MGAHDCDAVVIGGGHNGLVCGAYLARAGARVVVLESREKVGGAADTSAPFPDHPEIRVSTYAYVMSLMPQWMIRELELARFGYRVRPLGPAVQAFPDGRALAVYADDPARTHESVARFSKRDADRLEGWYAWLEAVTDVVQPLLVQVPPALGSSRPRDLFEQARIAWKLRKLGTSGVANLTQLFASSVSDLLDDWFESDEVKGALGYGGLLGAWAGPHAPGTAFTMLHLAMGEVGDAGTGSWGFPEGGMGAVAEALRASAEQSGCEVRTGARVESILTRAGRVIGVALPNGDEFRAPVVVTTIHPQLAFLRLLDRDALPGDFVRAIQRWKTRAGAVKINVALSELPDLRAFPGRQLNEHHTGSINLSPTLEVAEHSFFEAQVEHVAATAPISDGVLCTAADPTLAPDGVHVFSIFTQWVPHEWSEAPHREELEAYADRVIDAYAEHAPNFRRALMARQVIGPYDMEQDVGLVGGNVYHGEISADQLFHMRPAPGYADYRTPLRGLYHGSSATHAGGGVTGIPGWQACRQALRDRAIARA